MQLRDKTITIKENEFLIVPRGVEHRPVAKEEVCIMLFEPASTVTVSYTHLDVYKRQILRYAKQYWNTIAYLSIKSKIS